MYNNKLLFQSIYENIEESDRSLNSSLLRGDGARGGGGFFLDVVIGEGSSVLELLPGKDKPLLIRGNPLLVLDLGLNVLVLLYGVGRLNL